ncbi:type II secretion system F family protein [Gallibacterium genomosp. 3]|uniref:MaoC protein n=1 Tax=Gallibacterium genomosp. 3 TaxID=505345 RepID=A0A1A7QA81_9PAST|nr:type II secretion system F family protein [Gallibacterium genomosp. 3]OBX11793.1 MaoC protein [Gallibacterium genomosp. 3]
MNIYYLILIFGFLLILFTGLSWFKTKRLVTTQSSSFSEKMKMLWNSILETRRLWAFYFVNGNSKHLIRNICVSLIIFLFFYFLNIYYIQLSNELFITLFIVCFILLVWRIGRRRTRNMFEESFPEVLQIINSAVSSGTGLLVAFERCGKDIQGLFGKEMQNIHRRLVLGEDPETVFNDSYSRYPYREYYFFIVTIRMNLSRGGQIREVMSRLGRAIADSKKMEQKKKAMTSEARMSALIVSSFPVGFFIFMRWMQPENYDFLVNNPSGRIVLYGVFGSEILGFLIIWWLMRKST